MTSARGPTVTSIGGLKPIPVRWKNFVTLSGVHTNHPALFLYYDWPLAMLQRDTARCDVHYKATTGRGCSCDPCAYRSCGKRGGGEGCGKGLDIGPHDKFYSVNAPLVLPDRALARSIRPYK